MKRNIMMTMAGKFAILFCNFLVVVLTAKWWGAEGRGQVAMFVADVGLLAIISSVFTGSSVSYYLKKMGAKTLFTFSFFWLLFSSAVGTILFFFLETQEDAHFFFLVSFFLGCLSFYNSLFVGSQRLGWYNLLTVLQPVSLLLFLFVFHYFIEGGFRSYFFAWTLSSALLLLVVFVCHRTSIFFQFRSLRKNDALQLFKFGFQTQLSEFLQFFNTRLSYYFLVYHAGEAKLGVFSIGVALSEAVLVVARSISMVQYSRILGEGIGKTEAKEVTREGLKYCLMFTLIVLVVANLLPNEIFTFIFGDEFYEVKRILLWLSPGIFFASISNIIGHYFSAMGSLRILVLKSVIGVIVTFVVSVFAISRWHIDGAILVNLSSNFITFLVLWFAYRKFDVTMNDNMRKNDSP